MTSPTDAELRALAEKAPKGEWFDNSYHGIFAVDKEVGDAEENYVVQIAAVIDFDYQEHGGDALFGKKAIATRDFIAACSPDRILALLDGKAAAERERDAAYRATSEEMGWRAKFELEADALRTSLTRAEAEWEHAARHLADICDAQDAGEDVRSHVHAASAYLLAAGAKEPSARAALPAQPKEGEPR